MKRISGFSHILATGFETNCSLNTTGLTTGSKIKNLDNGSWYFTVHYYDEKGRPIQTISQNHLSGSDRISISYSYINHKILCTVQEHKTSYDSVDIGQRFVYDHHGRLLEHYHQIKGKTEVLLSALKNKIFGKSIEKYLYSEDTSSVKKSFQKLEYGNNIRGWVTSINDPENLGTNLFAMEIGYNDSTIVSPDLGANSFYNGNISSLKWRTLTNSLKAYTYDYDDANRLKKANYGDLNNWATNAFDVSNITYDENGNILTLTRKDETQIMDSLSYTYSGNRLKSMVDHGNLSQGFSYSGSPDDYQYDSLGNLIADDYKGFNVSYNYLNLPKLIDFGTDDIEYIYNASGWKLQKIVHETSTTTTDYVGNFVYVNGELEYILTSEGRVVPTGSSYNYEYHLKDHLGNTRVAFNIQEDSVNLLQIADYYPFGTTSYLFESSVDNNYLYNGKEFQDDKGLDWFDFKARYYDPIIGRFTGEDPIAVAFAELSPYNYASNNPSTMIDLWGLQAVDTKDDDPVKKYGYIETVTIYGHRKQKESDEDKTASEPDSPNWDFPAILIENPFTPEYWEKIWNSVNEEIAQESSEAGKARDKQRQQEIQDKLKEEKQKQRDKSINQFTVDKETAKSNFESQREYFEKYFDYVASPTGSLTAFLIDVATDSKATGILGAGLSVANTTYHYTQGDYNLETFLEYLGLDALSVVAPTAPYYKRAIQYIKEANWELENYLRSGEFWGQYYGY
jgi:RHS repeat-associated protein